jgi:hypothetical protein
MISIETNKELDQKVYDDFRDFSIGGVDFGKIIRNDHPLINLENSNDYINNFYSDHAEEIDRSVAELKKALKEKDGYLKQYIRDIFGDSSLDKKYTGYLSIFNCNSRYLENRTFQIFYKKDLLSKQEVCFHEVLHFQFFDYCDGQLRIETSGLDKNSGVLWELSEILNVILMNEPEFRSFFNREEKLFYPALKSKLEIAKRIWTDSGRNIDLLVKNYLKQKI